MCYCGCAPQITLYTMFSGVEYAGIIWLNPQTLINHLISQSRGQFPPSVCKSQRGLENDICINR